MDDGFTFDVPGLPGFLAELRQLPQAIQTKVSKGAVATAASVIRKEIIRRAPDSGDAGPQKVGGSAPGTLKRAIYQVLNTQQSSPVQVTFKVGVRRGRGATKKVNGRDISADAFYASWVEYGHFARVPHKTGKTARAAFEAIGVAKWVPAHPFFRPGVAAASEPAMLAMRDYFLANLPLATASMTYLKAA